MTLSVDDMQKQMARELSLGSRLGHTALLVVSASVSALTASLWLTEAVAAAANTPRLRARSWRSDSPGRVRVVGLANRRVMLANQRVIASRMALAFTALFLIGAVLLRPRLGLGGILVSAAFFAVAGINVVVARRRFMRLAARRRSLERGEKP
jgi:hypothetical protein